MKNVVIRGPVLTSSGYGCHSRQVASWLLSRTDFNVKFQPTPWGQTPWIHDRNRFDGLIGRMLDQSVPFNDSGFDVSYQVQLPHEWNQKLAKFNVGITAGIETDICNPQWPQDCNKMDAIIVPSQHSKNSMNPSMVSKPFYVVPESYQSSCTKNASELPASPRFSTPFNFFIFGQITGNNVKNDRKNLFTSMKWLLEEFRGDKNVGIVIKTNVGRNTLIDKNQVVDLIKTLTNEIRKGDYPKVHLISGDLSNDEVAALYKHEQIKCLVSATRGEGFGLPLLEAAVAGLPIIATPWSGHMDFLKKGKFIELYYQLTEIHPSRVDNTLFMPAARWADVSEIDFKKKVRKFYMNSTIPKEWAIDLSQKLSAEFSTDKINERYDEVMKELGL